MARFELRRYFEVQGLGVVERPAQRSSDARSQLFAAATLELRRRIRRAVDKELESPLVLGLPARLSQFCLPEK